MFQIKTATDASRIVINAIQSHESLWQKIDKIEDRTVRSERIYDQKKLIEGGLGWSNNWSYGKARMRIEKNVSEEVKSIMDALNLCDIEFEVFNPDKHKKKQDVFLQIDFLRSLFSRVISDCFIDAILLDQRFQMMLINCEFNVVSYGYCAITNDEFSYLGSANHVRTIAFEDRTNFNNITTWVCFDYIKGEFLYDKYNAIKDQTGEKNWKEDAIFDIISTILEPFNKNEDEEIRISSWDDIEEVITKNGGASWFYYNTNNVRLAKIYQFIEGEFWETYLSIAQDISARDFSAGMISCGDKILYQKNHGKIKQSAVINIVKGFSIGPNQAVHELRGIGKFVAEDGMRFDRKKNSVEDKLQLSGSPFFSTGNSLTEEKLNISVAGGYVLLGQGIEPIPNQVRFDLSPHINSIQMDEANFSQDFNHYNPTLQGRLTSRPTTDEVQAQSSEVSQQRTAKLAAKLNDYSALLGTIFNSLWDNTFVNSPLDKEVQDRFFETITDAFSNYGVEMKDVKGILKHVKRIRITPVFGDLAAIKEALATAANSNARRYLLVCYLITMGFNRADIKLILEETDDGHEVQMAALENSAFYNTSEVVFYIGQDHIGHLNTHFAKFDRILNGASQGEDPVKAFNYLSNGLQNTEKHVEALRVIPFYNKKYKEFREIQDIFVAKLKQMAQMVEQMKQQIAQQAAAQQQEGGQQQGGGGQQGGIPPAEAEKLRIKNVESMEKMRRANEASEQRAKIKEVEAAQRMEHASRKTEADIDNKKQIAELKSDVEIMKQSLNLMKSNDN